MAKYLKSIVVVFIMSLSSFSMADPISDIHKLDTYIKKHCKGKGCVKTSDLYKALIKATKEQGVNPIYILAIIRQESSFKVKATNVGNYGLSQVLLRYHRNKFKTRDYFNVEDNIRVGASIFKDCRGKHKDNLRQSFRCYNGYHLGDKHYYSKISKHIKELGALNVNLKPVNF